MNTNESIDSLRARVSQLETDLACSRGMATYQASLARHYQSRLLGAETLITAMRAERSAVQQANVQQLAIAS